MPRRPRKPPAVRRAGQAPSTAKAGATRRRPPKPLVIAAVTLAAIAAAAWALAPEGPERLVARAEKAAHGGDWPAALRLWRAVNRTRLASGRTWMAEARACLSLDRAADAERALRRATEADPADPEPWRAELQLLRVEDRPLEAARIGWQAYDAVPPEARRAVLRDLTLALLADLPDHVARETLGRWVAADPDDVHARVALLRRIARQPVSGDPDRATRLETLRAILDRDPGLTSAREALATALADAGEPELGRQVLHTWPLDARDARYWRLLGRWQLDYDRQFEPAVASFEHALADLPHDWSTQYRLARALRALGRADEARRVAETVRRLRELLDPDALGPRLNADIARIDDSRSLLDLSALCARAGLTRLADAWRQESLLAATPAGVGR